MTKLKLNIMMEGLIATAVEKIYVLGWEDAQEDVKRIIDMVNDLELFWDEDGKLTGVDWGMKIAETVEKARG
ncbi:hypothetical protein [Clostridium formicaceticum]|nr:hypothetical protein [Clostridium formicaceticum]